MVGDGGWSQGAKGTARKVMLEERGVGNKGGFRFWGRRRRRRLRGGVMSEWKGNRNDKGGEYDRRGESSYQKRNERNLSQSLQRTVVLV